MNSQAYTIRSFFPFVAVAALLPFMATAQSSDSAAQNRCLELAGQPFSGVPANPGLQEASLEALNKARRFCEAAIAIGSADGATYFHLGVALQHDGSHEAAIGRFQEASEAGVAAADTKLGDYYLFGIGHVKADADIAVEYYRKASEAGDLGATTTLAFMYRLGRGVPRDIGEMVRLMSIAAEGGYHFAQYRLAQTYMTGDGIPGGVDASLNIPDVNKALQLLEAAADQGNTNATLELAELYADNGNGVPENLEGLARLTQRAADKNEPDAIATLGFLFEKGRGVEADPLRAAELYVQAMETGAVKFSDLRGQIGGRTPYWDRATAIEFQKILQERGLYLAAIDGVVGPLTTAAAKALSD